MSRGFFFLLVTALVGAGGAYWFTNKDKNRLRLDNFQLRSPSASTSEGPLAVKTGEKLRLIYSMRGATAGANGNCRVEQVVTVSGPSRVVFLEARRLPDGGTAMADLSQAGVIEEYHKNTDITSLECNAEATAPAPGSYELLVHVHDHVANKDFDKKVPFTVSE